MAQSSTGNMTLQLFGIFLVALLLGAAGQLCMKTALNNYTAAHGELTGMGGLLRAMLTVGVVIGLSLFVVSSMLYLFCMSKIQLSVLYPMVALNYVFVTILAAVFLREHIPPLRIVALMVIIGGVSLMAFSGKPPQPPAAAGQEAPAT